ncbi:DUF1232 domain-containing protein [Oculatella sp. LEGE 06141]|uniref:YkvA family protein n=1 Tax=Oculatella sp. LEGE 06141 TaxID=1828648 RepID=UPI00187EE4F3|nr:YkvA family protein [Oculatella sp. LEGE 06141]MBE9180435.1 DUF1232 domain-containing protein [Oculatella sp. LEGE 06141]
MKISVQSIYEWYGKLIRDPKYRWWIVLATLAYLVSPIDLIPDFLPIAGQLDDVFIASLLFAEVSQMLIGRIKDQRGTRSTGSADDASSGSTKQASAVDVEAVSAE